LHIWSVGPGIYAAEIEVADALPSSPNAYKSRLPVGCGLVHVTVEVNSSPSEADSQATAD
jgi:hypothetical protein